MKIVLADMSIAVREQVGGLLERAGHTVIGQAYDADNMARVVRELAAQDNLPDVLVSDVQMPPEMHDDGLKSALRLRRAYPNMGIMLLSQYARPSHVAALFEPGLLGAPSAGDDPGGIGYLVKERISRVIDFLRSLQVVASGGTSIDADVVTALVQENRTALKDLNAEEISMLGPIAAGMTCEQMEHVLSLPPQTAVGRVNALFGKLGMYGEEEGHRARDLMRFLTAQGA